MTASWPNKERDNIRKKSVIVKLICFGGIIFLIFMIQALAKEMIRKQKINQEIAEIQKEIDILERKNRELEALVEYLNSESFKELQARQNLGLQKEGETAVAVESIPESKQSDDFVFGKEDSLSKSNPEKWWIYFFGEK